MSPDRVDRLRREVGRAWDRLVMDEAMLNQGNLSKREASLVLHFLEHAHSANVYPPKVSGNRHHTLCADAMAAALCVGGRAQAAWGLGI